MGARSIASSIGWAAIEIEKLRSENEALRIDVKTKTNDVRRHERTIADLQQRISRLGKMRLTPRAHRRARDSGGPDSADRSDTDRSASSG